MVDWKTDPQVRQRDLVVELDGYTGVGLPIKLSRTPGSVRTPPRGPGADTDEVLRGLGVVIPADDATTGGS